MNEVAIGQATVQRGRKENRLGRWLKRGLPGFAGLFILLSLAGVVYQAIGSAQDTRRYPPPGQLVDVGGYRMHIHCMGEGSPAVILDHVGDTNSAQWGLVQPAVARQTRVCAYDRAGFGWSDPGPAPRDARQSARELRALLANAGLPGPYLIAGHSFGANVARIFAADYPDDVAGLVLVDPGFVDDRPGVPADVQEQINNDGGFITRAAPFLTRIGLLRLAAALGALPGHGDLPADLGKAFDAHQQTTQFWETFHRQGDAFPVTSAQVLAAEQQMGALPLLVLSADQPQEDAWRQAWTTVNEEIAALAPNGIHRTVPGSNHMSLALNREHADVTSAAILEMVEALRLGQPLSTTR